MTSLLQIARMQSYPLLELFIMLLFALPLHGPVVNTHIQQGCLQLVGIGQREIRRRQMAQRSPEFNRGRESGI